MKVYKVITIVIVSICCIESLNSQDCTALMQERIDLEVVREKWLKKLTIKVVEQK